MKEKWGVFLCLLSILGMCWPVCLSAVAASSVMHYNKAGEVQADSNNAAVSVLGKNKAAQAGAWASLGFTAALFSWLNYKTCEQILESCMEYIPFLHSYHEKTAKIAALTITAPFSLVALMRYGPLVKYFFYILYAGERVSPLLARDALHDVRVYVEHLQSIKGVQKDLYDVINQINQMSQGDSVTPKREREAAAIDPALLMALEQAIQHDELYLHNVLQQLQQFLSAEELLSYAQELSSLQGAYAKDYSIASELQQQTQAVITQLQATVLSMGDDTILLNNLMQGLVDYWQRYTMSLADGIDSAIRFCNEVHTAEQIISKWLDRSLLCA